MTPMRTVRCAAAAVAVAVFASACKDSTGPGDPLVGSWSVTVKNLIYNGAVPPDTGTITPAPFTLKLGKSGSGYTATFPALMWNVRIQGIPVNAPIPPSDSVQYSTSSSGDTLQVNIPESSAGTGCAVTISGVFVAAGAQGSIHLAGGTCGTLGGPEAATGSWTATKQ